MITTMLSNKATRDAIEVRELLSILKETGENRIAQLSPGMRDKALNVLNEIFKYQQKFECDIKG